MTATTKTKTVKKVKKVTVQEALKKSKWVNIERAFIQYHHFNISEEEDRNALKNLKKAYFEFWNTTPIPLEKPVDVMIQYGSDGFAIFGKYDNEQDMNDHDTVLDMTNWGKWLSYNIYEDTLKNLSHAEITSFVLEIICQFGHSQEEVFRNRRDYEKFREQNPHLFMDGDDDEDFDDE